MRRKALDKEHVDDDNDRHMIENMHAFYMHKCLTVPIAWMVFNESNNNKTHSHFYEKQNTTTEHEQHEE